MVTKDEIIARLKTSRSWKEFGISLGEVLYVLENSTSPDIDEISQLKEANAKLIAKNKKLRQELREAKEQ